MFDDCKSDSNINYYYNLKFEKEKYINIAIAIKNYYKNM